MDEVRIGFIPLVDCAVIVAAHEMGFAGNHGLRLRLSREPSWAAIRDKVAFGVLDAAHMLAPMPIAMTLGLGGTPKVPMLAPLGLGRGGNAITVSTSLYRAMREADSHAMSGPPAHSARALAKVASKRQADGLPRLRLASVYPFSCHDYELRLWLAAGGLETDQVELLVIPPVRMVENLMSGMVDGFCVGEPWNVLAQAEGHGIVIATKDDVAPAAPEKVLGMTRAWAEAHADTACRLVSALTEAAAWAADHRPETASLLASPSFVGLPTELIEGVLDDAGHRVSGNLSGHFIPQGSALDGSQIDWLVEQMCRWNRILHDNAIAVNIRRVFLSLSSPGQIDSPDDD